jgi:hypothetical protein
VDISKEQITINITGDFCPGEIINLSKPSTDIKPGNLTDIFKKGDLNITNLESPLTDSSDKIRKSGPHIKSSPRNTSLLKELDIGLVTIANNHIMDFGETGLNDTIKTLSENSVLYVGAGSNLDEAQRPAYNDIKGLRLAVLNFTAHEFSIANSEQPGANPIDVIENYKQIISAKTTSDFQIVIVHTGIEHYGYPSPSTQKLFRFYASLGVSAVVGHHSHCINGYEIYKSVPIFYGLGNFIFEGKGYPSTWQEGLLLQLTLTPGMETGFKSFAFVQNVIKRVLYLELINAELPEELTQKVVSAKWKEHLRNSPKRRNILNHLQKRGILARILNKLFPELVAKGIDAAYLNLLRNENSYEFLIDLIQDIIEDI